MKKENNLKLKKLRIDESFIPRERQAFKNLKYVLSPCRKLGSFRFSPSIHKCSQGENGESIL